MSPWNRVAWASENAMLLFASSARWVARSRCSGRSCDSTTWSAWPRAASTETATSSRRVNWPNGKDAGARTVGFEAVVQRLPGGEAEQEQVVAGERPGSDDRPAASGGVGSGAAVADRPPPRERTASTDRPKEGLLRRGDGFRREHAARLGVVVLEHDGQFVAAGDGSRQDDPDGPSVDLGIDRDAADDAHGWETPLALRTSTSP